LRLTARQSMPLPHPNYHRFHAELTVGVSRETGILVSCPSDPASMGDTRNRDNDSQSIFVEELGHRSRRWMSGARGIDEYSIASR
jgi:hypothetical protein